MDDIFQVVWKDEESYGSRAEATRAELLDLPPGDNLIVHQEDCALRMEVDCNCVPDIYYGPSTAKHQ